MKADFFGKKVGFTIFNQAAHTGISSMAALLPQLAGRNFNCSGTQCQTPGRLFINFQSLGIHPALLDAALFRRLRPAAAAAARSARAHSRGDARPRRRRRTHAFRRPREHVWPMCVCVSEHAVSVCVRYVGDPGGRASRSGPLWASHGAARLSSHQGCTKTCRRTHTHRSPLCAFTVRIARGVDPRPSELTIEWTPARQSWPRLLACQTLEYTVRMHVWGMPPRCLEKDQLSSRIMRQVLRRGGVGWVGEHEEGRGHVGNHAMFMFMLVYTYYGGGSSPSTCVLWRRQFSVDMRAYI